jgi:hypothetical protein
MLTAKRIRSFRPGTAAKLPNAAPLVFAHRPRRRSDCFNGLSEIGLIVRRTETIATSTAKTSPGRPRPPGADERADRQLPRPAKSRGRSGFC